MHKWCMEKSCSVKPGLLCITFAKQLTGIKVQSKAFA